MSITFFEALLSAAEKQWTRMGHSGHEWVVQENNWSLKAKNTVLDVWQGFEGAYESFFFQKYYWPEYVHYLEWVI